jgi:hypothetical protein
MFGIPSNISEKIKTLAFRQNERLPTISPLVEIRLVILNKLSI